MEIKIDVNEGRFKEVIDKELEAFSKEEIQDIIRKCIVTYLSDEEVIKSLFLERSRYNSGEYNPTPLLKDAVSKIDLTPAFKETEEAMVNYVKGNYKEMIINLMANMFVEGLAQTPDFRFHLTNAVQSGICAHLHDNHM